MINYSNSMLPKLLAKENITVQHGNYKTAWFDVKDRVLGLPLWKDMGKDVYDLLIGHEVGHALNTPYEGWHDSPEKLKGCPRSYINVVEDARIERMVKSSYPGLVASFQRGYKKLYDDEFFGPIDKVDWDQVKLIDKINLKAKIGQLIDVPFTDEEWVYMDRANKTETFDDVVQLVKDILSWTQDNQEELIQKPEPKADDTEEPEIKDKQEDVPQGHDDYQDEDDTEESKEEENTEASDVEEGKDETEEDADTEEPVYSAEPEHQEADISITDEAFRAKESSLLDSDDKGKQKAVIKPIETSIADKVVTTYKELKAARQKKLEECSYSSEKYATWSLPDYGFNEYISGVKKSVNFAVKEFEQRKAAYQYQRATTAKTGQINVNALWSYKTNDDIFLKATRLADAKSHGMMMLIDYSGSMSGSMKYVMDQVIHTVMFCKAVNIPFEVYGFTSTNPKLNWRIMEQFPGHIEMDELSMPLVISSELKKVEFMEALKWLYQRVAPTDGWYEDSIKAREEDWGSTPLNQALIIAEDLIKKFKRKHQVQKMNFVTFTDGDANRLFLHQDPRADVHTPYGGGLKINVGGKWVSTESSNSKTVTDAILTHISKLHGTNNIGFFMAEGSDWKWRLKDIAWSNNKYWDEASKEWAKEYRNNKCVHIENIYGYNDYYMVKSGKALSAQSEDFEIAEDASKNQIGTAFRKHAKGKKLNKVLMTKFGKAVA